MAGTAERPRQTSMPSPLATDLNGDYSNGPGSEGMDAEASAVSLLLPAASLLARLTFGVTFLRALFRLAFLEHSGSAEGPYSLSHHLTPLNCKEQKLETSAPWSSPLIHRERWTSGGPNEHKRVTCHG